MNWLRITRIALLPTIAWDFSVGILLAGLPISSWPVLAFIALALIYHGSMILNDVADLKIDKKANRNRPLVNGDIHPAAALFVGLAMYAVAAAICYVYYSISFELCIYLLATVVAYNFSPPVLRTHLGPALLATARAFSLMFGVSALLGPAAALNSIAYVNIMCYALYYLFISRMAQHEEDGMPATRGLSFVVMAYLTPTLLFAQDQYYLGLIPAIIIFIAFAVRRPWQQRKVFWTSDIVQAQTRSSLCMSPFVLGLCLLGTSSSSNHLFAIISFAVVAVTVTLAKRFAPE